MTRDEAVALVAAFERLMRVVAPIEHDGGLMSKTRAEACAAELLRIFPGPTEIPPPAPPVTGGKL